MGDDGVLGPLGWSLDELRGRQLSRLQDTVRRAYAAVPHYRRALDAAGVHPEDIRSLDDLARIPFTTKEDLRQNYPFGMFAVPREQVARIHASSGTTGRPTVVGYTAADVAMWSEVMARSIHAAGGRPGDIVHVAYGYGLFTGGLGAHYGAERVGAAVIPMSGGQTEKQVQLITDFQPRAILSTPTYLLTIADGFKKLGLDPRESSLEVAILGAEPWTEEMRREIEQTFDLDALDIYGLSEVMGPGVAGESAATKDGSHIWEDHFRPEIIDPLTDEVLETGRPGELVFTSLTKQALPIIRYRTHDLTRLLPGTTHPGHRRMGRITGRSDDMIILRGVNLFPSQIEELALKEPALSPHFTLEITRPDRMDQMAVNIERRDHASLEEAQACAAHLRMEIKTKIGSSCVINVVEPESLARSSGKLKRIYDLRDPA